MFCHFSQHFATLQQNQIFPELEKKVMHFIIVTGNILLTLKLLSKGVIRQREINGKQDKKRWMWMSRLFLGLWLVERDHPGCDSFIPQPKTQFSSSDQHWKIPTFCCCFLSGCLLDGQHRAVFSKYFNMCFIALIHFFKLVSLMVDRSWHCHSFYLIVLIISLIWVTSYDLALWWMHVD